MNLRRPADTHGLVFAWPEHWHLTGALPGMILLAAVLHLGAALLFQLVYPIAGSSASERAAVFQWPANPPPGFLLDLENPALFSPAQGDTSLPALAFPVDYFPSFDQSRAVLAIPEKPVSDLLLPAAQALGAPARPVFSSASPSAAPVPTPGWGVYWNVSGDLLLQTETPPQELPEAMRMAAGGTWWVGVDAEGLVRAVFLLHSSDSEAWDQAAESLLRQKHFSRRAEALPSESVRNHLLWGAVEIHTAPVRPSDPAPAFAP